MQIEEIADHRIWLERDGARCRLGDRESTLTVSPLSSSPGQESFSLTFATDEGAGIGQGISTVGFDDGAFAEVFVVPIAEDRLEAVFTRLVDADETGDR